MVHRESPGQLKHIQQKPAGTNPATTFFQRARERIIFPADYTTPLGAIAENPLRTITFLQQESGIRSKTFTEISE